MLEALIWIIIGLLPFGFGNKDPEESERDRADRRRLERQRRYMQRWMNLPEPRRPIGDRGFACEQCGYALAGLAEPRCPECGRPVAG